MSQMNAKSDYRYLGRWPNEEEAARRDEIIVHLNIRPDYSSDQPTLAGVRDPNALHVQRKLVVTEPERFVFDTGCTTTLLKGRMAQNMSPWATTLAIGITASGDALYLLKGSMQIDIFGDWKTIPFSIIIPSSGESQHKPRSSKQAVHLLGMGGLLDKYKFCVTHEGVDVFERLST